MATERREERIVTSSVPVENVGATVADLRPAATSLGGAASTTAQETATYTRDPYSAGREGARRVQAGIYLVFGVLAGLLGIRFVLALLGASQGAGFAQFVGNTTAPFIAPFVGLFGTSTVEGNVFDWNALVAIVAYGLLAWVLVRIAWLLLGDSRRGVVRTSSSQTGTTER